MSQFDFVVIGSGVAGLSLSLKLAEHGSVAIVTKRKPADSNTAWAQGGVACVTSVEDSFDLHIEDTLIAGAGLCDREAVRTIVTEGPAAVRELMRIGVHFDERTLEDGQRELDLGKEGGSPRGVSSIITIPQAGRSSSACLTQLSRNAISKFSTIIWPLT